MTSYITIILYAIILVAAIVLAIYGVVYLKQVTEIKNELNISLPKILTTLTLTSIAISLFTVVFVVFTIAFNPLP